LAFNQPIAILAILTLLGSLVQQAANLGNVRDGALLQRLDLRADEFEARSIFPFAGRLSRFLRWRVILDVDIVDDAYVAWRFGDRRKRSKIHPMMCCCGHRLVTQAVARCSGVDVFAC
jgi:hypothetical protein